MAREKLSIPQLKIKANDVRRDVVHLPSAFLDGAHRTGGLAGATLDALGWVDDVPLLGFSGDAGGGAPTGTLGAADALLRDEEGEQRLAGVRGTRPFLHVRLVLATDSSRLAS